MARIFSSVQFNQHTFSFDGATAAAATNTVIGNAASGYRYGLTTYDNTMTTTYNGGQTRLLSYADNVVRPTTGPDAGTVTAGTMDVFFKQNLVGTAWRSFFTMSDIDGSAVAYDAALRSGDTSDDRDFLEAALGGNDLFTLSKFNDDAHGREGNDTMRGGLGNDWLIGDQGLDRVDGGYGNDTVYGDDGNDVVIGGRGVDFVSGGDNNDTVSGGDGNDTLSGGSGDDVFLFRTGDDRDTLTFFSQGNDLLQVSGMTSATTWTKAQDGDDAVISVMGIQIVVLDTTIAQMTIADFILS
jgi:Ca2+-binding RTX toxin-like protein